MGLTNEEIQRYINTHSGTLHPDHFNKESWLIGWPTNYPIKLAHEVLQLREHNFELQQRHIQYVVELQKATAKINKLESQIDLAVEALELADDEIHAAYSIDDNYVGNKINAALKKIRGE